MKKWLLVPAAISFVSLSPFVMAQSATTQPTKDYGKSPIVTRMMAFDKKSDGKLTKDEITDDRLLRLFDQADTNKDGIVTKEELMTLAAKLEAEDSSGGRRGGPGGPGDRGGPMGPGGGLGGPPRPGQIMPPMLQERLNLTDEQKKQIADLQKEVDDKLAKILTEEQMGQMKRMRDRGPGSRPANRGPD